MEEYNYPKYINKHLIINNLKNISQNLYCKITNINVCYYSIIRFSISGLYINIFFHNEKIGHLSIHFSEKGESIMHWIDDENKKRYDIKFKIIFNNENIENILLMYKNNIPSNKHKIITDKIYNIINSKYDNSYLFYKNRRSNSIISNNELNNNQTNSNTISNIIKNLSRTYSYTTEKYYEQYCKSGKNHPFVEIIRKEENKILILHI